MTFGAGWLGAGVRRNAVAKNYAKWRETGSDLLGKRIKRVFGRRVAGAVVNKWVPGEDNRGLALWHVLHDDGDEVRGASRVQSNPTTGTLFFCALVVGMLAFSSSDRVPNWFGFGPCIESE